MAKSNDDATRIGPLLVGDRPLPQATDAERRGQDLQQRVLAPYEGVGKFCTEITEATWLTEPVQARGNPGIYDTQVPTSCLPK